MSYPGNPSLSADLQQRVLSTFEQTRSLAASGNRQEALLGCDFILRLDPDFEPARRLHLRLEESDGPVEVTDLDPGTAELEGDENLAALDDLDDELPPLEELPPEAAPADEDALGAALSDLLERRELKRLVQVAEERKQEIGADPELRKLVETAFSLLEAEPYLESFLDAARNALKEGDLEEADRLLAKARSLDPSHPGIAEVETARTYYADPERLMGSRRDTDAGSLEATRPGVAIDQGGDAEPDFDTDPGIEPASDDASDRIPELLAEGQAAFDRGEYQAAIDAWSRIFLIDIDHEEAGRLIEGARKLKEEGDRRVEEIFHDATMAEDAGELDAARQGYGQVLELAPHHLAARDALDRLEGGGAAVAGKAAAAATGPLTPPAGSEALDAEVLVPPDPDAGGEAATAVAGAEVPRRSFAAAPAAPRPPLTRFLLIGGGVLVLVLAVVWLVLPQWDRFFPNSDPDATVTAPARDLFTTAKNLYEQGQVAAAIAGLERVHTSDPRYDEAQELLSEWRTQLDIEEIGEEAPPAVSPEQRARQAAIVAEAERAASRREYLVASQYLEQAAELAPLSDEAAALSGRVDTELEPLAQELELYELRDWEFVLPRLWRLYQNDPGNRDVERLIIDSYYNLGMRDLQRNDAARAAEWLEEARKLAPEDAEVERHLLFARTYRTRSKDLLYKIYVKYLPFR